MTTALEISRSFRDDVARRGGDGAARCMQCATCSAVCDLGQAAFPRRQILHAQWGLESRLLGDPSIWLCHQCNDCNLRCPRDARPGDAMQAIRSVVIERAAAPRFMGRLVGNAASTWPLLLGLPVLFWVLAIAALSGFSASAGPLVYAE
ncbi:MAG: 4Fe-4S dicluster domain-containing protein, partial [Myxococcales bacterium]